MLAAGLWLVAPALGVTAGSILAPPLARRIRPAFAMSLGIALGIATLGSIGTAIFRERTGGTYIADGAGTTLSPAAQAAFAAGLNAVAGICAVAVLGFAIMAAPALPTTRSASNAAATA